MGLDKQFNELNIMANEISSAVYNIYVNYLDNVLGFPSKTVAVLENKYDLMRQKVYKSKYSKINEIFNNFSAKKKEKWTKLNAPTKEDVFAQASERVLPQIIENIDKYLPSDDKTKIDISVRLMPIIKNLKLNSITGLYREFKKYVSKNNLDNSNITFVYLQELFVGFIISKLSHNSMNKYSRSRVMYTYEDICKKILNEPVLSLDKVKGKGK